MLPLGVLAAALGLNYRQHKRGKPTMCSTTRKVIPPLVFVALWGVLTEWLVRHYIDGFKIQLDKLTD